MENYEGIGYAIGSFVGALITGIFIYLTKNVIFIFVCLICVYFGGQIGKNIKREKNKN